MQPHIYSKLENNLHDPNFIARLNHFHYQLSYPPPPL